MIERFVPGAGGVENVAWQVAHELARSGEEVSVIARESAPDAALDVMRVRVPSFWQPMRVARFSAAAARVTSGERFEVVHSFSRTRHQDLFRAGGGSHADYLARSHSSLGRAARQISPRHRVLLELERRVFADARQRIQCASRLVADHLIEAHGVAQSRLLLLPNAVDAHRFGSPAAREAGRRLRQELAGTAEQIWLFPASGWHRKGLDTVFEALALRRDPGLQVWIAGRGDERPWRRKARRAGISDRVRFLGVRDDLEAVYAAVDGMLLPTRYDAFANVTLEAAAAGLPIVTTKANGAAEWLEGALHCVDDATDAPSVARALGALGSESDRRALGERARKRAQALDWTSHVDALREEYARIIARKRQRPQS